MTIVILLTLYISIMYSVNTKFQLILRSSETVRASKQQAAESRERVIDAAAKLFREKGFDGIGVDDLMKSAGFTHGGFYRHFSSKEDLMSQASARAIEQSLDDWKRVVEQDPGGAIDRLTKSYLSPIHRDNPGLGCLFAALGPEVARQHPPVRQAVTAGLRACIELLTSLVRGDSEEAKRHEAIRTFAGMVGALLLARAVDDPQFSEEILNAAADPHT